MTEPEQALSKQRIFNSPEVVFAYARRRALQPPERTVLRLLGDWLRSARMLDLGVGGGRTSHHFLPLVQQYVGVDFAPRMIQACRRTFPDRADCFQVADVRRLGELFADGSFDFVLFSYNGLDYVSHGDRMAVLGEVHRVLRGGGLFCLSAHNLLSLSRRSWPGPLWPPGRAFARTKAELLLRLLNDAQELAALPERTWAVVRDLPRHRAYYITPEGQLDQLAEAGFANVQFFDLEEGRTLSRAAAVAATDPWLYYLCEKR